MSHGLRGGLRERGLDACRRIGASVRRPYTYATSAFAHIGY